MWIIFQKKKKITLGRVMPVSMLSGVHLDEFLHCAKSENSITEGRILLKLKGFLYIKLFLVNIRSNTGPWSYFFNQNSNTQRGWRRSACCAFCNAVSLILWNYMLVLVTFFFISQKVWMYMQFHVELKHLTLLCISILYIAFQLDLHSWSLFHAVWRRR